METKVLLTKDKKTNSEVYLLACDDGDNSGLGSVKVMFPDMTYDLYDRDILYIADRAFLVLNACKGCRINVMYPLKSYEELVVRDFLSYWGSKRLQELKQAKWLGFLGYWKHILEFVDKNVDVERLKPTYETYYVDNRDYGGSESVYFNIRMSYGKNWHHDFDKTHKLNDLLVGEQIDRSFDDLDEERWFSKIHVNFKPSADNIEDFVKFDYEEKMVIENWEKDCVIPIESFIKSIKSGMGTDGNGFYSDGKTKVNKKVNLDNIDYSYSHVVWYDK